MNLHAAPFLISAIYLTLIVAYSMTILETGYDGLVVKRTMHRWGKFLLLLVGLGIVIQFISLLV